MQRAHHLLNTLEKDIQLTNKKLASAKKVVSDKAHQATAAAKRAYEKASQEVKSHSDDLSVLKAKINEARAEHKLAKIMDQVRSAEELALTKVRDAEKNLESKAKHEFRLAKEKFEAEWAKSRAKQDARKIADLIKTAQANVKKVERKAQAQATAYIKAEQKKLAAKAKSKTKRKAPAKKRASAKKTASAQTASNNPASGSATA